MKIEIDHVGRIVEGNDAGTYVKVIDDTQSTGGFLILTSVHYDMLDGFDNWVENKESLARYFTESGWVIEWINDEHSGTPNTPDE